MLFSPMSFLQRPFRWLQAISRYRFTISGGPNFAYDLCVEKVTPEQRATLDLSSWRLAFNGAEPVRAETIDRFAKMFEPCGFRREAFYPCYGMAESTLIITGGFKSALPVVRSFDAKALENNQVRRRRRTTKREPRRWSAAAASCWISGWRSSIRTRSTQAAGRPGGRDLGLRAQRGPGLLEPARGDRADLPRLSCKTPAKARSCAPATWAFCKDGELFITGRLKDLIIIRGRNYYPQDIEQTAGKSHSRLRSRPRGRVYRRSRRPAAAGVVHEVERRQQRELEPVFEAIRREVAAEHELPVDAIVLIKAGSIPKTSSGKIQRHACPAGISGRDAWKSWPSGGLGDGEPASRPTPARVRAAAARPTDGHRRPPATNGAAILPPAPSTADIVMAHVRRVAKERAAGMTLDSSIVELGLDSLERMEIVAGLEEQFGGRFPEEVLDQIETPREVAAAVDRYLGKAPPSRSNRVRAGGEIPPAYYQFDQFPEYLKLKHLRRRGAGLGLARSLFQGARRRDRRHDDDRRPQAGQLRQLQLPGHVGRSEGRRPPRSGPSTSIGTSVSASRLVSGEKPLHGELERDAGPIPGRRSLHHFRRRPRGQRNDAGPPVRPRRSDPARRAWPTTASCRGRCCRALAAGRSRTTTGKRWINC